MAFKIFLGDDSFAIRKLAEIAGEGKEWEIFYFDSTDDLLEKLESEKPNIIFLSIDLQGQSVLSVAEKIKTTGNTKDIPLVLLKGAFFEEENDERIKHFDRILDKPFSTEDFLSTIEELTGEKSEALPDSLPEEEQIYNTPEEIKGAFSDSSDFSDLSLPEEEEEKTEGVYEPESKDEEGEHEETIEVSESFEEISQPGVGIYPVEETEVQPNDEETIESGKVKMEDLEKEREEIENPFDEEGFEEEVEKVEIEEKEGEEGEIYEEKLIEIDMGEDKKIEKKETIEESKSTEGVWGTEEGEKEETSFTEEKEIEEEIDEEEQSVFVDEEEVDGEKMVKEETLDTEKEQEFEVEDIVEEETIKEEIDIHEIPTQEIQEKEEFKDTSSLQMISKEEIEKIVKLKVEEILWEILPDITEKIVKEELEKVREELLKLEE